MAQTRPGSDTPRSPHAAEQEGAGRTGREGARTVCRGDTYLLKQCAAVSTQQLLRSVAPQSSLPSPRDDLSRSAACHGQPPLRRKRPRVSIPVGQTHTESSGSRAGGRGRKGIEDRRSPPALRTMPPRPRANRTLHILTRAGSPHTSRREVCPLSSLTSPERPEERLTHKAPVFH